MTLSYAKKVLNQFHLFPDRAMFPASNVFLVWWAIFANISNRTQHLRSLISQKASFSWSDQHEAEFQDLQSAPLPTEVILFHPDWDGEFQVYTHASKIGCGAMLVKHQNGVFSAVSPRSLRSLDVHCQRNPLAHSAPRIVSCQMGSRAIQPLPCRPQIQSRHRPRKFEVFYLRLNLIFPVFHILV